MARFPNCVVRAAPFLSAIFVAPLLITTGAQATTLFSASASASASVSLTVTGITNLTSGDPLDIEILGGVFETDPFGSAPLAEVFTVGAASGSTTSAVSPGLTPTDFDDPTALRIGDSLMIDLTASGTADPIGYADAFNAAFGLITIENLSMSDTVEFSFELVVDLMTDASVDDFLLEDALAFAGVDAYSVFFLGSGFHRNRRSGRFVRPTCFVVFEFGDTAGFLFDHRPRGFRRH